VWLDRLAEWLAAHHSPDDRLALLGDFNVAPEDRDVWSVKAFEGSTHVTGPEREALARLRGWGLVDAFRRVRPEARLFSYWDYRRGDFHQHRGMRIDLVYVTEPLAEAVTFALVDRTPARARPVDQARWSRLAPATGSGADRRPGRITRRRPRRAQWLVDQARSRDSVRASRRETCIWLTPRRSPICDCDRPS